MKTYADKLKDPRWQKLRLEIFERDNFQCVACGHKERTLHVHHKEYLPRTSPWDYPEDALMTLCEQCHRSVEHAIDLVRRNAHIRWLSYVVRKMIDFDDSVGGDDTAVLEMFKANDVLNPDKGEPASTAQRPDSSPSLVRSTNGLK